MPLGSVTRLVAGKLVVVVYTLSDTRYRGVTRSPLYGVLVFTCFRCALGRPCWVAPAVFFTRRLFSVKPQICCETARLFAPRVARRATVASQSRVSLSRGARP